MSAVTQVNFVMRGMGNGFLGKFFLCLFLCHFGKKLNIISRNSFILRKVVCRRQFHANTAADFPSDAGPWHFLQTLKWCFHGLLHFHCHHPCSWAQTGAWATASSPAAEPKVLITVVFGWKETRDGTARELRSDDFSWRAPLMHSLTWKQSDRWLTLT